MLSSRSRPDAATRTSVPSAESSPLVPTLRVRGLSVTFDIAPVALQAVKQLDLTVERGEISGIVGESGSGKTTAALAIANLLASNARWSCEALEIAGKDISKNSEEQWRLVRYNLLGFVFQDPSTHLNPTMRIGDQVGEALAINGKLSRKEVALRVHDLLNEVGIPEAKRVAELYPHQLSGGMQQRAVIATALACDPILLLADEPTTALDVTTQAQILDLIGTLARERGMATVLITHDLGVAARICDRISVMYGGEIVESADVFATFARPSMPYTKALLEAVPQLGVREGRLLAIEGAPPDLVGSGPGCLFAPRCAEARTVCWASHPALTVRESNAHLARCFGTEVDGWIGG